VATIRIDTVNVENLFARYKFNKTIDPQKAVIDGWLADPRHVDASNDTSQNLRSQAILATKADVPVLQEVEHLDALKRFRNLYLGSRKTYRYAVVINGKGHEAIGEHEEYGGP